MEKLNDPGQVRKMWIIRGEKVVLPPSTLPCEEPMIKPNFMNPKISRGTKRAIRPLNRFGALFMSSLGMLIPAIVFGLVGTGQAEKLGPATVAIKQTIDQVLAILADEDLKDPEHESERRVKLEEVIGERFDYEEMGKRTLAAHWNELNPSQQKEFVKLFQSFLSNSYAGNIDGYAGEKIEYLGERHKGDFAEVQTRVISSKTQLPLDYRLLHKNGEYRVYDVVIDGVSLIKNYRGQFSRIIKSSSYDGLLDKLRNKTDQFAKPKRSSALFFFDAQGRQRFA